MTYDLCQISLALEIIGGKWKGPIIWYLKDSPVRFNALKRKLDGITQRTLTNQLKELIKDGMVLRKQYNEVPPKVEYSITPLGKSIFPILDKLSLWGKQNQKKIEKARFDYLK